MAKRYAIELAMMVRQARIVVVEVPDNFDVENEFDVLSSTVYGSDDHGELYTDDGQWGCEEATHHLIGPADKKSKTDFVVKVGDSGNLTVEEKKRKK